MNANTLWSLRLGFSNRQANKIEEMGIEKFLKQSFSTRYKEQLPSFIDSEPKTLAELKEFKLNVKNAVSEEQRKILKKQINNSIEFKKWWIAKMQDNEYPLREKMVLFWHNHFVATSQKVKVNYWVYQHNQLLRENAFGNFKELTKKIIRTNAMVRFLDNIDNKKDKINENLSRELLELFTIGIGNYSETDIKEGARALAGLGLGNNEAKYRRQFEDQSDKTYFGKTGNWKSDDLVDMIFEQKNIPYLITRKILKWFIYDSPPEELIKYYGDYFRKVNFEIEPLLIKIFTEEYPKKNAGSKIKDPLLFIIQLTDELQIKEYGNGLIAIFLKQQGMDLLNQPNVKGWDGGNLWLTSQIYLQRNKTVDMLSSGKILSRKTTEQNTEVVTAIDRNFEKTNVAVAFDSNENNKQIIEELCNRLLFKTNDSMQKDMEMILKYDFDAKEANAPNAVLRLFNYIAKTPEYQLL
ncbi:DUF1800 domain-containing protein [Flavobacterium sp. SUN046]|uniref:DUF1800 domain-containing protein n=1 Tax=Flavobacterium sp. SUN046 TaxID=3002440 RepID=UPI002DB6D909|nr:DUF1800 domain-containing protein [Flavobacterium sp. SUN046]MEC4048536.1 DUF1800 domain-containing protein [Flavobacterium sp. SUN046]